MLLVCRDGLVIARHDDGQDVRSSAYGPDAVMLPWAGRFDFFDPVHEPDVRVFKPVGAVPPPGVTDVRPAGVPPLTKAHLHAAAAYRRWEAEIGGVAVSGIRVATDDRAQRKVSELRQRAEAGEIATPFDFIAMTGGASLDLAAIAAVDMAISAHVQATYVVRKAVDAAIEAGTITTLDQIAAAGWPENG